MKPRFNFVPDRGPPRKGQHIEPLSLSDAILNWDTLCPRKETVSGLLNLLHKHKIVQVRGTPASGKATLMHLLHARIKHKYPNAHTHIFKNWPSANYGKLEWEQRMQQYLPGWPTFQDCRRYFLFDEGQSSYWDENLWIIFKDYIQAAGRSNEAFVILFCSYGNESVRDPEQKSTPLEFGEAKVALSRTLNSSVPSGSKPFGLLLDREECYDVIGRRGPKLLITKDLQDFIYELTSGHVGCVLTVIDFLVVKV
ncbi:hypothetical protein CPB86DRAFT_15952 [Serendipita vermifera]|nr:hypothetical protein CPB86DRAFT_15952 [Serendipita vermifera]